MRWLVLFAAAAASLFAQLPAPNAAGVSMGHIHLTVPDPEAQMKVWTEVLGAQASKAGPLNLLKLPGIFIIVSKANATEGTDGSTVNHIGFLVKDYVALKTKLEAAHVATVFDRPANRQIMANFPDQIHVEFFEDTSLATPVAFHHIHITTTDPDSLQAWYIKTFGAEKSHRRDYPSAKIPAAEVDFSKAKEAAAPTKGRTLDHIGFEVKDLEPFVKQLQAQGVTIDMPFRDIPAIALKIAFIIDPVGTRIELTQGLAGR
ncbi:MAG TPA: VOC family protein [Bryobacteraceae bacterium]|nr:VOC family protein [Bryobacteraceae bacterium]